MQEGQKLIWMRTISVHPKYLCKQTQCSSDINGVGPTRLGLIPLSTLSLLLLMVTPTCQAGVLMLWI